MLERELEEIARRTGLERRSASAGACPCFVHGPTAQEFVLVPAGTFAMGMSADELRAALRQVSYNPDIAPWREAHARTYGAARPTHSVAVQPFLVGRSPLLGGSAARAGVRWSTHETAEHRESTAAAAMTPEGAVAALSHFGWELPTEAQWEYVARSGGADVWAGGVHFSEAIDAQVLDPRYRGDDEHCNAWGIWGLGLGEWIADEWHDDYVGHPNDGSSWRNGTGLPSAYRGGGVLHAPWQDSDEALSCHAAARGGRGAWRGVFVARPVIALPWLHVAISCPPAAPECPPFDEAVAPLEAELRAERERRKRAELELRAKHERLRKELPGSIQRGTIRSVGDPGVYIVRLPDVNGILRLPPDAAPLSPGDHVVVRVTGTGGVPTVELVSVERS
jgi:formylglycine-generating enzyme required for sulfatase activity